MSGLAPSEDDLIAAARGGDAAAFEAIVRLHGPAMRRVARAITGDDALADDAWQDAFVAAHRALAGYRGQGSLRAWLLAIVRNAARKLLRERSGHDDEPEVFTLGLAAGWGEASPEDVAVASRDRAQLWAALDRLEPDDRELLVLRDLEGQSGDEVAAALGIALSAMKSRLHRARLRLLAALTHPGGPR
ncbi:MAG: sigma-70 family RNA polymerase sigma factor [Nannocystaceae bacterium]|nr:sigma-70 family RNA polymerase sigma factor [Nannocystaceae bacterium]